jgi:hypothetical protein
MSTALGPYSQTNNYVFDPSQVSGLSLWLDAADDATVIRTGVNVTRWNDKSGSNNTAVAGTATYPIYSPNSLNSLPVIQLRAANDYFIVANNFTYSAFPSLTYFIVMKPFGTQQSISALGVLSTDTPNFYGRSLMLNGTNGNYRQERYSAFADITPYSSTRWDVVSMQFDTTVSASFTLNGTLFNLTATASGTNTASFIIGSAPNSPYTGFNANLDIGEILVYAASLTTAQRQQIESYLAWKWNLQRNLPTTHPYYNSPYVAYNQIVNIPQRIFNNNTLFPNQISGLSLWLDGADPLNNGSQPTSGTVISTWSDKSGNGYNATVASGRVAGTFNTVFNCVYFQASNVGYATNYPANPTNETMFIVANIDSPANINNNTIIGGQRGARSFGFGYSGIGGIGTSSYLNSQVAWQNTFVTGPPTQITALITGTVSNTTNATVSLNGATSGASYTSGTIAAWTAGTTTYLAVDTTNTSYYYKGYVMEILFYNSILSTRQQQQIEGYLAYKWNLKSNLPLTHPAYTPSFVPSGSINVKPYIWAPTQISGCALWLDAADSKTVITTGSTVTQWNDKSGNGYNMSSNTNYATTTLPTYSSNTINKYVQMTPNQALCSALYNYTTAWSVFVCMNNVIVGERFMVSPYVTVNLVMMSMNLGNNKIWQNAFTTTPTDIIGNHIEYTSAENTNALSNLLYYRDGFIQASNVKNIGVAANASAKMGIGANATVNNAMSGTYQVYEIVIYNTYLNIQQRQQIEGYLAWKWNLQKSLPSSHPFFNFPPG